MTAISRRALARNTGGVSFLSSQAGLLASTALRPARASGLTLANAIEFSAGKVLYQDAAKIFSGAVSQAFTQSIFLNTSIQPTAFMLPTYPGDMTLVSLTDPLGHPRFQVKMLPSSVLIKGSTGNNPSLQVLGAYDTTGKIFFSYVIPNFLQVLSNQSGRYLSDWETMEVRVGILGTPARWIVEAGSFNQRTAQLRAGAGYWTNLGGSIPNVDQTNPLAFNIPLRSSGITGDTRGLVFSVGAPMTSAAGGYRLLGSQSGRYYEQFYGKMANLIFDPNPGNNFSLADTFPHFLNWSGTTLVNKATNAISQAAIKVSTAWEVANAVYHQAEYSSISDATQAVNDALATTSAALTAIGNAGNQAIAHADAVYAYSQTVQAQQFLNAATKQYQLYNNTIAAGQNTLSAMEQLGYAMDSLGYALTAAYPPVPTSVPSIVPVPSAYSTIFPATPGPAVNLSGSGTVTDVNISNGNIITDFGSNDPPGVASLESTQGQAPGTPIDDGTGVTIESITITGM